MCECGGSEYDDTCICIPSVTGWVNLSSTSGATLTKSFRESSLNPLICTIEKLAHRDSGRATGKVHMKGWHTVSAWKHWLLL